MRLQSAPVHFDMRARARALMCALKIALAKFGLVRFRPARRAVAALRFRARAHQWRHFFVRFAAWAWRGRAPADAQPLAGQRPICLLLSAAALSKLPVALEPSRQVTNARVAGVANANLSATSTVVAAPMVLLFGH